MSWSIGFDKKWGRDIGYGVPAFCDHPECLEEIDRGLAYVCCGQQPYGGEDGCGLYFCAKHATPGEHKCERCAAGLLSFDGKPEHPEWIHFKKTDESWAQWREEHPEAIALMMRETETLVVGYFENSF